MARVILAAAKCTLCTRRAEYTFRATDAGGQPCVVFVHSDRTSRSGALETRQVTGHTSTGGGWTETTEAYLDARDWPRTPARATA